VLLDNQSDSYQTSKAELFKKSLIDQDQPFLIENLWNN